MATIQYADIDTKLQVELGDLTGNIWDTATRKQKLNEAIGWFSRMWPYEQEMSYPIVLNATQQVVSLPLPDSLSQPPWRVLGVLIVGKRCTMQPDTADDDPNSLISDALINKALTWRLKWPDTIVFNQPLGSGTGLNDPSIVGQQMTIIAWFAWYDFDVSPTSLIDLSFEQLVLLKAAELCQLWAQPLAARLGRDMGSKDAAASYALRVAEIVAALHPQITQARPLKKGAQ
jgi:hypothetical protein